MNCPLRAVVWFVVLLLSASDAATQDNPTERGDAAANAGKYAEATADDDKMRDGAKAEGARELMPSEPRIWDTRAAVCTELGRFEEAVKWQKRYLGVRTLNTEHRKNGVRFNLYQQRQACQQRPVGDSERHLSESENGGNIPSHGQERIT